MYRTRLWEISLVLLSTVCIDMYVDNFVTITKCNVVMNIFCIFLFISLFLYFPPIYQCNHDSCIMSYVIEKLLHNTHNIITKDSSV